MRKSTIFERRNLVSPGLGGKKQKFRKLSKDNWAPGPNCLGPNCPGPNCPGPNSPGPNLPRTLYLGEIYAGDEVSTNVAAGNDRVENEEDKDLQSLFEKLHHGAAAKHFSPV